MTLSNQNLVLDKMINDLFRSPKLYQPSEFWQNLNREHIDQIQSDGLQNFKRSVNSRYFNWGVLEIFHHQWKPFLHALSRGNICPITESSFDYKLHTISGMNFNSISAIIYRTYVSALYDYISELDSLNLLTKIHEPLFGNPFLISYKNRILSQDLCNSIHEFYSITKAINLKSNAHIAELGAGYGRLGYVFLSALNKSDYTVIDIPPALYIAQSYLSKVFPKKNIFTYRSFSNYSSIKNQYQKTSIKFLLPYQLEKLPQKSINLFLNVSSLHEMTRPQIDNYFSQINRLTEGYFYTKQWRRSQTKDNDHITEYEYPTPPHWKTIYHRRHPIQDMFFEALYKID
jgi:putative sugar O-methyltransferase